MSLSAENLMNKIHQIINDLKQDIYTRFNYNLDENLTYLDLTRNLILLENVINEESIKNSQEQQKRLVNNQNYHSNSSIMNRSYNTANYSTSPYILQNQNELFVDQSYYNNQPYFQQQNYDLDTSKDSIPQYHKQLLKEYKNSMDQLKKQNQIIRTIVKENSHQHLQNNNYRDNYDRGYHQRDHSSNTFETNYGNQTSSEDLQIRQKQKSQMNLNKSYDNNRGQRNSYKLQNSSKKQFEKAEKELQELQYMREKELQKIKQIERAIRLREEVQVPENISSSEVEILDYVKSQNKVKDRQYISKINGQISNLDREIRQITSYIQDCILKSK